MIYFPPTPEFSFSSQYYSSDFAFGIFCLTNLVNQLFKTHIMEF